MVNNPNPVPPTGPQSPQGPQEAQKPDKNTGAYQFSESHKFLGMNFTAKEWNKLMNIMLNNLNSFISKTYQKAIQKMKKDWERGEGKDVD
jgi:hypothetical protein